jgi:hypothetical protein
MQHLTTVRVEGSRPVEWRRRLAQLAVAGVLALGAFLGAAGIAQAGNYQVIECYPGLNNNFPDLVAGGWDNSTIGANLTCDQAGQVYEPGLFMYARSYTSSQMSAYGAVYAPTGAYFHTVSFRDFRGAVNCNFTSYYWNAFVTSGGYVLGGAPGCTGPRVDGPTWLSNSTSLVWAVQCNPSQNPGGGCVHEDDGNWSNSMGVGDLNLEVTDTATPTLALSGEAVVDNIVAGQVLLNVAATDQGSGVYSGSVSINGTKLTNLSTSCPGIAGSYAYQVRPCGNLNQTLQLNTAAAPFHEGQNTLNVCISDWATYAGTTPNTKCDSRTLNVDNSCTDSQGAQQSSAASLNADLENPANGAKSKSVTLYSTEGTKLTGDLRTSSSAPVAGASICLYEQIDAPAEIRQLTQTTKTRSDGGYQLQIPAGPSRDYDVVYRTNANTLQQRGLHLDSVVVPTLDVGPDTTGGAQVSAKRGSRRGGAIRNGQSAVFSGQIPGPYAADRVVALEALIGRGCSKRKHRGTAAAAKKRKRCRPNKWRTFKTVRTEPDGRYSGIYRFTQTHGRVVYSFRATVPDQAGYPYRAGSSSVRHVTVRGPRLG